MAPLSPQIALVATVPVVGGTVVAGLALLVLLVVVLRQRRAAREAQQAQESTRAELEAVRARLDALGAQVDRAGRKPVGEVEFLITDAGEVLAADQLTAVPDRLVLSTALGNPLLKTVALGHGVRHALRAESRSRIVSAVRRETRRARKERRREMRVAWREYRARQQGDVDLLGASEEQGDAA
ncbi:MAG: hypothetical protein ABIV05_05465 [Actinomycetota bacterium]